VVLAVDFEPMNSSFNLTSTQLKRAAAIKDKIASLENKLAKIIGKLGPDAVAQPTKRKGGMSAAGRARVAAAQRARWAKIKAAKKAGF